MRDLVPTDIHLLSSYLNAEHLFTLPSYKRVFFSSQGEEVFFEESSVIPTISAGLGNEIPHSIEVTTYERVLYLVFNTDYSDAKERFYQQAKEQQLSVIWIDSSALEPLIGEEDDSFDPSVVFTQTALRKWIHCPVIDLQYEIWLENLSTDDFSEHVKDEDDFFLESSELVFSLETENTLSGFLLFVYGFSVDESFNKAGKSGVLFTEQVIAEAISLVFLQNNTKAFTLSKLVDLVWRVVPCSPDLRAFLLYHTKEFNWSAKAFKTVKHTLPKYQIPGLLDFVASKATKGTDEKLLEIEKKLKQPFMSVLDIIERLSYSQIEDNSVNVNRKVLEGQCHNKAHFEKCDEFTFRHQDYVAKTITYEKLSNAMENLSTLRDDALKSNSSVYQCQTCHSIFIDKNNTCCSDNVLNILPAAAKDYGFSIKDALSQLARIFKKKNKPSSKIKPL